jgi:hypothetical protein
MHKIRLLMIAYKVDVHNIQLVYRCHVKDELIATQLTLLVLSDEKTNHTWPAAIKILHTYVITSGFPTQAIEIIDHCISRGMSTRPLLPTSNPSLTRNIERRTPLIQRLLDEYGVEWSSSEC